MTRFLAAGLISALFVAGARADDAPKTADEAVKKGLEAAQGGNIKAAVPLFEAALKLDPKNRQALFFNAAVAQMLAPQEKDAAKKSAMFIKSAKLMRTIRDAHKVLQPNEKGLLSQALYNEACAYALDKKDDKALEVLTEAIDAGFSDAKNLENDTDLVALHKSPKFAALVDTVKKNAEKAAKEREEMEAKMAAEQVKKVKDEIKAFKSFKFDFDLKDLDDKSVKLSSYKGKVTIVDVWGTWCPPCRMEIPHFVKLHEKYKAKGFDIVGINYERGPAAQHKNLIASFNKEFKVPYTCVLGDEKTQEMIPEFRGYPTTLFLDREGKVRYQLVGYTAMPILEEIIQTLMAEGPAKTASN